MKVCHVITRLIVGGAQENTLLTCEGLQARGHRVTLLTGPDAGSEGSLLKRAKEGGYRTTIIRDMHRAIRPVDDWHAKCEMSAVFRKLKPEIVHTHSSKAGVLARVAAREAGVPVIVHTIHGMSFNRTQPWYIRKAYAWLEWYCGRFTDRLITVADAMIDQSVAAGVAPREKFTTVHSGMLTDWYDPQRFDGDAIRRGWGFNKADVVVGTVARLFRNKGYEQLIPAMAKAVKRCPKLRFVWIGDGGERDQYLAQLEQLGLRDKVYLTGLIEPSKVAEMLAGVDMVVHASQWEGLPRAAVQSLLMQKPVISFSIDGAPEVVVPGQTGILVPLNDTDALAEAMVDLGSNSELRGEFGQQGRALCLEQFDHRKMVEQIEAVYQELSSSALSGKPVG
jgi:glycosyltransferase involved in cell wall biosynthesis